MLNWCVWPVFKPAIPIGDLLSVKRLRDITALSAGGEEAVVSVATAVPVTENSRGDEYKRPRLAAMYEKHEIFSFIGSRRTWNA